MDVDVEFQERYWYPDDGGEVWVAGYYPVDATGRFLSREALPDDLIVTHVAGAVHRKPALESEEAAPGAPLTLRPEPDNPHDPNAVSVWDAEARAQAGYVPREQAADLAPRLAGLEAFALWEWRDEDGRRCGLRILVAPRDSLSERPRPLRD